MRGLTPDSLIKIKGDLHVLESDLNLNRHYLEGKHYHNFLMLDRARTN